MKNIILVLLSCFVGMSIEVGGPLIDYIQRNMVDQNSETMPVSECITSLSGDESPLNVRCSGLPVGRAVTADSSPIRGTVTAFRPTITFGPPIITFRPPFSFTTFTSDIPPIEQTVTSTFTINYTTTVTGSSVFTTVITTIMTRPNLITVTQTPTRPGFTTVTQTTLVCPTSPVCPKFTQTNIPVSTFTTTITKLCPTPTSIIPPICSTVVITVPPICPTVITTTRSRLTRPVH